MLLVKNINSIESSWILWKIFIYLHINFIISYLYLSSKSLWNFIYKKNSSKISITEKPLLHLFNIWSIDFN